MTFLVLEQETETEFLSVHYFDCSKYNCTCLESRIKRGPIKDFTVTKHTKLCSAHFRKEDFVDFYAVEKNLNFLLDNERT
ncbi:hypothetical protein P5673_007434 [Acropora cervicornis]|uniref:THAP-type domain-containing protein n=1 Tax=Acropora cervicornis TaxID=6130 RepID=A0AAD9QVY5_ACRCE|nr:hypothetical protein P5673_007434 [Acropora cervicornis]